MNNPYAADVRRFGGPHPYLDEDGNRRNLRHQIDFPADEVVTDGEGNVAAMPLLLKKPCFGRPERLYRAVLGSVPWTDDKGRRKPGKTPCTECSNRCPGISLACANLCSERVAARPSVQAALDEWTEAVGTILGRKGFIGSRAPLWRNFLDAIIDAGGWTNVNDDQIRLHQHAEAEAKRRAHNERRKAKRAAIRLARKGQGGPLTGDFLDALNEERDRRAADLKKLRPLAVGKDMSWLKNMPDETCERVADFWREREIGRRTGREFKQIEIADRLIRQGRSHGAASRAILASRISDDVKRLRRLENDQGRQPIWPAWRHAPVKTGP